jgi:hypothetical protein
VDAVLGSAPNVERIDEGTDQRFGPLSPAVAG